MTDKRMRRKVVREQDQMQWVCVSLHSAAVALSLSLSRCHFVSSLSRLVSRTNNGRRPAAAQTAAEAHTSTNQSARTRSSTEQCLLKQLCSAKVNVEIPE